MKFLLDTHIVIWLAREPQKLSSKVVQILENKNNDVYFSTINLWEIAIKTSLQRDDFYFDVVKLRAELLAHDFKELVISGNYAPYIAQLPFHHKDPFDRMLIAQAMANNLCLITQDNKIRQYQGVNLLH